MSKEMSKDIRVARVLDNMDYKLVLNVGKNDGVNIGDNFLIYCIDKDPIIDPVTGENLGDLEITKGRGKVISVQDRICIIESTRKKQTVVRKGNILSIYGDEVKEEDLPFDDPKIGDFAKKIN